ncbi:hypothetical protein [Halobacterium litoreum]|uniref:Uncharacterized protein n=1 Tax=Halobacterium litoreum TaxID=2039234 RepID=A0ABD5NFJ1_9EURY|nr:hypothetical protein [Halobacterium litoreum]UHH13276.1 hypothetical protein LT972_14100 [Halobacterium litoreum]
MSETDNNNTTDRPPEQPVADQRPNPQQTAQPSISDLATDETTKAYVKFVTACFALVGAAAGLAVVLVGFLGGAPLSPDIIVSPNTFLDNFDAVMGQLYANRLAFQTMNAAPVAAGLLGVAGGLYTATTLDGTDRHTYVASALAGGVGAFVLVVVVGVLASVAVSTVPTPQPSETASALSGTTAQTSQLSSASGAISAVYIGGTKLAFDKLAFNAVAVGVGVGAVSAASAYVAREYAPTN